jgi:hypothetical protein
MTPIAGQGAQGVPVPMLSILSSGAPRFPLLLLSLLLLSLLAASPQGDSSMIISRVVHCRDPSDCTGDLQAAIDSGEDIELASGIWTVRPGRS